MGLFLSTIINKIDKKGRVSVPASFRLTLGNEGFQGVILFRSYRCQALEGCGLHYMERLSGSVDQLDLFSEAQDDFASTLFADAHQIGFDGEGRILLPESLISFGNLKEQVAFVGRGTTFQIWDPAAFKSHQDQARIRLKSHPKTLRLEGGKGSVGGGMDDL